MKNRISKGAYILTCVVSGVLLYQAASTGADHLQSYNLFYTLDDVLDGAVKLGIGIAVYYIGRDISQRIKAG